MRLPLAVLLGIFCCLAQAAESAYTVRATELKARPASDAPTVAKLPENQKVDVVKHETHWVEVKADRATGWLRQVSLRFDDSSAPKKSGDSGFGSLFSAATTGSSGSTPTTGVKGVTEENLKNAQPNPRDLQAVNGYGVGKTEAQQFARSGKLVAQHVNYLGE